MAPLKFLLPRSPPIRALGRHYYPGTLVGSNFPLSLQQSGCLRQSLVCSRRRYHGTNVVSQKESNPLEQGLNFSLYDSLSQSIKEVPVVTNGKDHDDPKALAWYTCGPTTYSAMHLGHARTYVWFDMMRRVLEFVCTARGAPAPLFVMNITDIDDKIIAAADETKEEDAMTISRRSEAKFWKDMDRLGCQRPHITTRVSEYVDSDIVPYIERLVQQEMAYVGNDGVYFDVQSFEEKVGGATKYGKLAGEAIKSSSENITDMHSTSEHLSEKRDRRDFALWKRRKEGENVYWSSPWGEGRPGWHIECSAMIEAVQQQFQETHRFAVHAGGVDLKFPHHTNEIAQAEAYHHGKCHCPSHNEEWIPHWVHTGHLMVKDAKMSKSLKNFLTVDELWSDYDPNTSSSLDAPADDFRLWCLMGGSYSHREEFSRSKIRNARQSREKILRFLLDGEEWLQQCNSAGDSEEHSKRWQEADHNLFNSINQASQEAYQALLKNMRGTAYVDALVRIAEDCKAHIRQKDPSDGSIVEPIKFGLQTCRDLLSLLGFSDSTVRAGLIEKSESGNNASLGSNSYVIGGEKAIVEELVQFRAAVRQAALEEVKSKKGEDSGSAKAILKACDELRDNMPKIGIEVMDSSKQDSTWRFCVPKQDKDGID